MPDPLSRLIRVLVVEPQAEDFAFLRGLLEKGAVHRYQVDWAATYEEGLRALVRKRHDIGLFGYELGPLTGLDLLRESVTLGCRMPVILTAQQEALEVDQAASMAGAADYLGKAQLDSVRLERSIRYALRQTELLGESQRTSRLLRAIIDNVPVLVGRIDSRGRVLEAQGQGLAERGLRPERLIGRPLVEFLPPGREAIERALAGQPGQFTLSWVDDGDVGEAEFHVFADPENKGGAIFFGRDISLRRRLEKRLLSISEEEQRRIGADLHDGLGQQLTGIACLATALRDQLRSQGSPEAGEAEEIARLLNEALDHTRAHARGLCPVKVEHGGLNAALEDLAYQVQRLHGVQCRFENGGPPLNVGPEVAIQLYRIAQEAVNNAVRHGAADQISVKLQTRAKPSRLVIEDNGRGFDPAALRSGPGGMGLHLMEHRAAHIGASFSIIPQPRGGVRVECALDRE